MQRNPDIMVTIITQVKFKAKFTKLVGIFRSLQLNTHAAQIVHYLLTGNKMNRA